MKCIVQAEVQLILPETRKCMSWTCEVTSSPVFYDSANLSFRLTQQCQCALMAPWLPALMGTCTVLNTRASET